MLRKYSDLTDAEKEEIKQFAKDMYFEVDNGGKQLYGFREISEKIKEVFNVGYSHITIFNWAKDGDWKQVFKIGMKLGEQKAIDTLKNRYNINVDKFHNDIIDDEVYKKKVAQIKRAVIMQQAKVVRKMLSYVEHLPETSSQLPNAGRAFSDANKILFDMIAKSPLGENQRINLNIQVINPEKMTVMGNNVE